MALWKSLPRRPAHDSWEVSRVPDFTTVLDHAQTVVYIVFLLVCIVLGMVKIRNARKK